MVLAGYKEFTWDIVFERLNKFSNEDMDICIVSSGLYDERLSEIAKINNWSYVSIKRNSVPLAQNTTIRLFPDAEYIYKIDEDIFITENFFDTLKNTYEEVQENSEYNVGFVAPIIPINGYAHIRLLEKLNLIDCYEEKFEKVKYDAELERMIVSNTDVSKFMWGEGGFIPHIDDLNRFLQESDFSFSAASVKFSIGAILYNRKLWEDMLYFNVDITNGLGADEREICSYCLIKSKSIIVSENTCVGHLSFGPQNKEMEKYFKENQNRFKIKDP